MVEDVADLWAMERSGAFRGRYHVLGGVLSAIDGVTVPEPQGAFYVYPDVSALLGRDFDGSTPQTSAELAGLMQAYLGRSLSPFRQDFTALIGQAGERISGIYEADYREFNRDTYVRGRETFDRTWAEVKELILGAWWRDLQLEKAELNGKEDEADGQAQAS